jgi:pimeloyl-ACP methyl ester carboxylesterase
MTDSNNLTKEFITIEVNGVKLRIACMHREGRRPPVVFLHGFGSTKEDYADLACCPQFKDRRTIAFDAPGCGETECADLSALSIPFLQHTAERVLEQYGVGRFHLAGHSMGGLAALLLACDGGNSILSFTNIEGNLAPEDCFLSRQILEHPAGDPDGFLKTLADRAWQSRTFSHRLFASALPYKVRTEAVAPIFRSMVEITDNERLLAKFTGLACPTMFVYGDQNRSLSYLGTLMRRGVQLAEIERSGHWPMYANPPALWAQIGQFIEQAEMEDSHE